MKENNQKKGKKRAKIETKKTLSGPEIPVIKQKKDGPNDFHKAVIQEYFVNGFNAVKAVLAIKPDHAYNTAKTIGTSIIKDKRNQYYIDQIRTDLNSSALVDREQILQEWNNFAFSDITDYIGLTSQQLKELPPPVRRCLSVVDIKTVSYFSEKLNTMVTEETIKLKLISKERFHEMLGKYLDIFNADNKSKQAVINLNKIDKATIQVLLNATTAPNTGE